MQACRLRPTIAYTNTAQNRFRSAFGINDINVEIAIIVKNAAVIQLKGRFLAAATAVFLHQLLVGKWTLGILVTVMQVAVSGRRIQIKIGFLNIFAMIAFVTGKAKSAFFKDGVAPIPERQRETQALFLVTDAAQSILIPAISART